MVHGRFSGNHAELFIMATTEYKHDEHRALQTLEPTLRIRPKTKRRVQQNNLKSCKILRKAVPVKAFLILFYSETSAVCVQAVRIGLFPGALKFNSRIPALTTTRRSIKRIWFRCSLYFCAWVFHDWGKHCGVPYTRPHHRPPFNKTHLAQMQLYFCAWVSHG